jgi:putative signal transducing protein
MARMSTASRADGDAPKSYRRWGFALLGAAIAVGLVGGLTLPSRVRYVLFVGLVLAAALTLMGRGRRPGRGRSASGARGLALGTSEMVAVTVVPNEAEADLVCGMFETNGVACRSRQTDFGAGSMDGMPGGPQQILVQESDVDRARDLLARAAR